MFVYRPSRLTALATYTKRFIRRNKISHPYLSGDAFASLADFKVNTIEDLRHNDALKLIRSATVLFVRSDLLEDFLIATGDTLNSKVIIAGNSDQEFFHLPAPLPKHTKRLYLQNNFIQNDPLVSTIPIGLENYRLGVNGNPKFIERNLLLSDATHEVLFGPFSFTHNIRKEVFDTFSASPGPWRYLHDWIPPSKFNEVARQYKYVGAVRGNGVDTHRLWEALYRGNIPIVKKDSWSLSLSHLNLPIAYVDEWSRENIIQLISENLDRVPAKKIPSLWINYWQGLINRDCGS